MQAQTVKRTLKFQVMAIGLAATVAVAGGITLISGVDLLPGGNSDSITVQQARPTFHRPADRTGVSSNDGVYETPAREFHLPADRARLIGGDSEPAAPANRPLDRGLGGN